MADTSISEVRISNMALSNVGASSSIETMTEASAEAAQCNLWYNFSRKQALAANDWSFARRRLILATHGDDPPGTWAYRYQYPVDCVKFRKLENPAGRKALAVPFDVELGDDQETKSILTDLDDATGVYTFNLVQVTLFSEFFVTMFAAALAVNICYSLTKKLKLKKELIMDFRSLSLVAQAADGNEQVSAPPREADWIEGR